MFDTYKNKKVFLTGHSGFKGSWLNLWLNTLGAEVLGYSLEPDTKPSLYNILKPKNSVTGNILDTAKLEKAVCDFKPDIVFHLAAQPIVRRSYFEPVLTYQTNVIGTLNVLEAARKCESVKAFVNITTDKCYENKEAQYAYCEDDPMGGYDMYSSSKGCVEIMSSSYRRSFLKDSFALATARAGNVIGGGDWADDRLVPDCIRAINNGEKIQIRNPYAIRPWQHVLEPLFGYLLLGEKLLNEGQKYAQGFNFGPEQSSVLKVSEVAQLICKNWGEGEVKIHKNDNLHEAQLLMLNIDKAKEILGFKPQYSAQKAIEKTVCWYKNFYSGEDMKAFTLKQIGEFSEVHSA